MASSFIWARNCPGNPRSDQFDLVLDEVFLLRARARERRTRSRFPQVRSLHQRRVLPFVRSKKTQRHPSLGQNFSRSLRFSASVSPNEAAMRESIQGHPGCSGTSPLCTPFWRWKRRTRTGTFKRELRVARSRASTGLPEVIFPAMRRRSERRLTSSATGTGQRSVWAKFQCLRNRGSHAGFFR